MLTASSVNEAKKVKLDVPQTKMTNSSRTVHIFNVPDGTTDAEIITLGLNFGRIANVVNGINKNQAMLEFFEETAALTMCNYYLQVPACIRGTRVFIQLSKESKQHADQNLSFGSMNFDIPSANGALTLMNNFQDSLTASQLHLPQFIQPSTSPLSFSSRSQSTASPEFSNFGSSCPTDGEKTVLRVIVEMGDNQTIYNQVNLDVLHHLFSRTGTVLKIITFAKPGYPQQFQALIQYAEAKGAKSAKELFDCQNLYYGCCPLKIEYSKLTNLNVKYNNEKSKDFTRPDLPSGDGPVAQYFDSAAALALAGILPTNFPTNPLGGLGCSTTAAASFNPLAFSAPTLPHPLAANSLNLTAQNALTAAGFRLPPSPNAVLLVGNLNSEKLTPDALFTLFGVYGDVQRVKILFNKQDNALVQMHNAQQAKICIDNLNDIKLYGKELRVTMSKHQIVQLPKEGQPDAGLTKDYSNSPLHRFRKEGSKNYQNIYPPSATLHLSNIAPTATEDQILDAFKKKEIAVVNFRFFPNDHKMALLQCHSKEDALIALVELHNYQLGENHHLRVSFSKTQMNSTITNGSTFASQLSNDGD